MKTNHMKQNTMAIMAALIWGTAFVAQSIGADYMEAFSFNAARSLIGFFALLIVCVIMQRLKKKTTNADDSSKPEKRRDYKKKLLLGGFCCGAAMTVASYFQQKGLETTTSGKAGFITALYIVIVPIIGIFLKKKAPWTVWISVAIAVVGLYCLCIQEDFTISEGDFYILLCSFCYSAQILLIDYFTQNVDGVELSCTQLFFVTILSAIGAALLGETPTMAAVSQCILPLLYVGVFSSGVAYTLQILAQKGSNPTVVSLLMSLESVFATLAGAVILHDQMSGREYFGCVLMLAAVVLAQLPSRRETEQLPTKSEV